MSKVWLSKPVADVCEVFTDGDWIETKDQAPNGIRLVQTGNVGNGYFKDRQEKARYISESTFIRLNCTEIRAGDCLVSRLPDPVGRSCLIPDTGEKMITAVDCTVMRFDKAQILPEFFSYYSQSLSYLRDVDALTTGATRMRISRKNLGKIEVPLPSLQEQDRIVALLRKTFKGIAAATANAEKNLQNSGELFESYLQSVFTENGKGWETDKALSEHVKFIDYRGRTPIKTGKGMRLITAKNVKKGFLQNEPAEFVSASIYDEWMTRGIPRKGDVLFTTEAPLANVAQLDTDEKVVFAQRIIIMQPEPRDIDQTFLKYLLMSAPIQKKILWQGTGATVKGIKAKLLKKIPISFPKKVSEQKHIVARLDALSADVQRLQTTYQKKLAGLSELHQSVLQKAFTGELH